TGERLTPTGSVGEVIASSFDSGFVEIKQAELDDTTRLIDYRRDRIAIDMRETGTQRCGGKAKAADAAQIGRDTGLGRALAETRHLLHQRQFGAALLAEIAASGSNARGRELTEIGDVGAQLRDDRTGMRAQVRADLDQSRFGYTVRNADELDHQQRSGFGAKARPQYLDIAAAMRGRAQRFEANRHGDKETALLAHETFDHADGMREGGEIELLERRRVILQDGRCLCAPRAAGYFRQHRH